jgi:hypothetical protein
MLKNDNPSNISRFINLHQIPESKNTLHSVLMNSHFNVCLIINLLSILMLEDKACQNRKQYLLSQTYVLCDSFCNALVYLTPPPIVTSIQHWPELLR